MKTALCCLMLCLSIYEAWAQVTSSKTKRENESGMLEERATGKRDSAVAPDCLSGSYLFIPNGEEYPDLRKKASAYRASRATAFTDTLSTPQHAALVYDWQTNRLTMYRPAGKNTKRFFVKSREFISLYVININPYLHTIEINDVVKNLHNEGRDKFEQQLGITTKRGEDVKHFFKKGEEAGEDAFNMLKKGACLAPELDLFYQRRRTDKSPDMDLLKAEIEKIDEKIKNTLEIEDQVSPEKIVEKVTELLKEVKTVEADKVKETASGYADQMRKGAELYGSITGVSYVTQSAVVQPGNNDILRFEPKIKEGQNVKVDESYEIPIVGGWKADFSTGIFLTGLRNFEYATRDSTIETQEGTDPDDEAGPITKKVIFRQNTGGFDLGIGVMAHFYRRMLFPVNVGFSLGVISTADVEPRFLLGLSTIIGQSQRLILNGGMAVGKVERLSSDLREDGFLEAKSDVVPTRKHTMARWFIGVTYNFTKAQ